MNSYTTTVELIFLQAVPVDLGLFPQIDSFIMFMFQLPVWCRYTRCSFKPDETLFGLNINHKNNLECTKNVPHLLLYFSNSSTH